MNDTTVIILAAGQSSRMYPFVNGIHKSMIPIMGKPILSYTLEALIKSEVKDVIIVVGPKSPIAEYFGNGGKFGISIKYVIQEKPEGAGNAILLAEKYIKKDFLLLNACHVDVGDFIADIKNAGKFSEKAMLIVKKREDTWNQGVLKFKNNKAVAIIEKPEKGKEPSKLCVVGVYLFNKDFLQMLRTVPKSHYQLEEGITKFIKNNSVKLVEIKSDTVSVKYAWDLLRVKNYLFKKLKRSISADSDISESAEIIGQVLIEEGAVIMEGARIKGPCFVGRNAVVGNNALLRNGADVEENSVIGAYMEIKNSIIMKNSTTHSGFIGDSIIGEYCRIAAQFCTGNVRLDRQQITVAFGVKKIETGLKHLGAIIGAKTNIGIKVSVMPGTVIGQNVTIGPSTSVAKNIEDNTKYYTKFQEVIVKKNE